MCYIFGCLFVTDDQTKECQNSAKFTVTTTVVRLGNNHHDTNFFSRFTTTDMAYVATKAGTKGSYF